MYACVYKFNHALRYGYGSRSASLSVCLSVHDYSRTTGYEAAYEQYQQLQCYKGMKNESTEVQNPRR